MKTLIQRLTPGLNLHRTYSTAVALCSLAMVWVLPSVSNAAGRQYLHGHVPEAVAHLQAVDRLPGTKQLNIVISLPLRNRETLTNVLQQIYDPSSPNYHHYLTPEQFAEQFGPSQSDYQAVQAFAKANGLELIGSHGNRTLVDVRGSVGQIEKAFHVTMRRYNHPTEARTFFAPDSEPSLDLQVPVLSINGLNDYLVPRPLSHKKSLTANTTNTPYAGSGPAGTYLGYDFRNAYVPGVVLDGAGQTVGLFELDGFFPGDITQYKSQAGLPDVPVTPVLLNGFNGAPGGANVEVALDIEVAIAMAPGLSQVLVYEGFNPLDILNRMATDNQAKQLSSSWGWFPFDPAIEQIYLQYAAQGQSMFQASGDSCAYVGGVFPPSDDPSLTIVGGTTLTTSGGGAWAAEKVWNWGGGIGSSGGISTKYQIPSWQQSVSMANNQGSTTMRNIPDVALTADNIFIVADNGLPEVVGGTSAAAPLWAGFLALVNQQAAQSGRPPLGFLNPTLYQIGQGGLYSACFHDIVTGDNTSPSSPNAFFAVPGYDLCTGWGSPAGSALINALAPSVNSPFFVIVTNTLFGGNGNGLIDPNECNNLSVVVQNVGTATATTVKGTLSTSTPGVAISHPEVAFPNLPVGASAASLSAFGISTSPDFVCGTPVRFTLVVKSDQTSTAVPFVLTTGFPGTPVRFDNSTPAAINDLSQTNSLIVVTNISSAISKVTVSLFLTHTFDSDLLLQLIGPDGTTNTLSRNNGGAGQNYGVACGPDSLRTTFDDAAPSPISAAFPPFLGSYQPDQPLAIFVGKTGTNINGTWKLHIEDQVGIDFGTLQCWSLFITPTTCLDGGGECPGADLAISMTASPRPVVVGQSLTYTVTVTNNGPGTAKNISVGQTLPQNALFISASPSQGGFSQSGGQLTWSAGQLSPGSTASIQVVIQPTSVGIVSSTATVSDAVQPDPNPANNTTTVSTQVNPPTSDLALTLGASPASVVLGNQVTYSISVLNNGPDPANGVTVTNILPANVGLLSATVSQGFVTINGNVVVCTLGHLENGATATASIVVLPTVEGSLVDTANVTSAELDPISPNNTASVTTAVGPAADLGIGLTASPTTIVSGSNMVYTVRVTNSGPSIAGNVTVTTLLATNVTITAVSTSQGSPVISNSTVIASLGSLAKGAIATNTIFVTSPHTISNVMLVASTSVTGGQADPNLANNSATISNIVAIPFISIVPASAVLISESFSPPDGAIENGETVTAQLFLQNMGNVPTTNLVATLLTNANVVPVPPNSPQSYPQLSPGPIALSAPFSFTASGPSGATVSAVLKLTAAPSFQTNVTFNFRLPSTVSFSNTNSIAIRDTNSGLPYPSTITVSGLSGTVGKVTATLVNLNHTFAPDIDALLVGPTGQDTILMSGAGGFSGVNATITFDDAASTVIPCDSQILSGAYQPGDCLPGTNLPPPAPQGPYTAGMSALNGASPNGTWSLFVDDHHRGDTGSIAGGWSLTLTLLTPVNQTADIAVIGTSLPSPVLAGSNLTNVFVITNYGPNAAVSVAFTNPLPATVAFVSATSSQGSIAQVGTNLIASLGSLSANSSATVTVVGVPSAAAAGLLTSTASAFATTGELDLNTANNTLSLPTTVVLPSSDVVVTQIATPDPVTVGSNLTYVLSVTNNGPQTALGTVLTSVLGTGLSYVSALPAPNLIASGTAIWNLGDLPSGAGTSITLTATPTAVGSAMNILSAATASALSNPAHATSTNLVTVNQRMPEIQAAGAVLTYESGPVNGAIDPGENVTIKLSLRNVGSTNTPSNFMATLLTGGGVSQIQGSATQTYGTLVPGGASTSQSFSFTATGAIGGTVTATLQLANGINTNITFVFNLPSAGNFANSAAIIIPDHGPGNPYPSTINVSGLTGQVSRVTATLNGFTHSFPRDVSALLVSPSGANVLLMSHAGVGISVTNLVLTFDDAAAGTLPFNTALTSGTYYPTNYVGPNGPAKLPDPAPSGSYGSALSGLNGSDPNGTWALYVFDDSAGDGGVIASGWSLSVSAIAPISPLADLALSVVSAPGAVYLGDNVTNLLVITNLGPSAATGVVLTNLLPANWSFISATASQGNISYAGGNVLGSFGSLNAHGSITLAVVGRPTSTAATNVFTVSANEQDLVPGDNTLLLPVTVINPAAVLHGAVQTNNFILTVTAPSSLVYEILVSSNLMTSWTSVSTNTSTNGVFQYIDPIVPGSQQRFYRAVKVGP